MRVFLEERTQQRPANQLLDKLRITVDFASDKRRINLLNKNESKTAGASHDRKPNFDLREPRQLRPKQPEKALGYTISFNEEKRNVLAAIRKPLKYDNKSTNQTSICDTFGMERMKLSDRYGNNNLGLRPTDEPDQKFSIQRTSTPTDEVDSAAPATGAKRKETIRTNLLTQKNPMLFNQIERLASALGNDRNKPSSGSYSTEKPNKSDGKFTSEEEWWNPTCSFIERTNRDQKTPTNAADSAYNESVFSQVQERNQKIKVEATFYKPLEALAVGEKLKIFPTHIVSVEEFFGCLSDATADHPNCLQTFPTSAIRELNFRLNKLENCDQYHSYSKARKSFLLHLTSIWKCTVYL